MTASISLVQPRHFRFAERVDRRRIHIERGELPDLRAVVRLAVRQLLRRQSRAHARHILVAHELQQLAIGGLHGVADDLRPPARAAPPARSAAMPGMSLNGV